MKQVKQQHKSTTDPVNMALGYAEETSAGGGCGTLRLAKALRRVYDDPHNPANPQCETSKLSPEQTKRDEQLRALGMQEVGLRRGSFVVDVKRTSLSNGGAPPYCQFDDAGQVAEAMVRLGADAVFINTDYHAYGGDLSELKSAVRRVRAASDTAAVVMKDIVVDEIQLGLAKEAGADGIVLQSAVLGAALDSFLDLATTIGLETVVECHTKNEVERALAILAPNILVHNYDRIQQKLYPEQAVQLAGLFPGSGGPIICLAGGGIDTVEKMKKHLAVGYDGVVVGKAVMGSPRAPEFIRAVRDRTLLPAEMAQWGIEAEFDMHGEIMSGPRSDIPAEDDAQAYQ